MTVGLVAIDGWAEAARGWWGTPVRVDGRRTARVRCRVANHPSGDRVPAGATALRLSACLRSDGSDPWVPRSMTEGGGNDPRAEWPIWPLVGLWRRQAAATVAHASNSRESPTGPRRRWIRTLPLNPNTAPKSEHCRAGRSSPWPRRRHARGVLRHDSAGIGPAGGSRDGSCDLRGVLRHESEGVGPADAGFGRVRRIRGATRHTPGRRSGRSGRQVRLGSRRPGTPPSRRGSEARRVSWVAVRSWSLRGCNRTGPHRCRGPLRCEGAGVAGGACVAGASALPGRRRCRGAPTVSPAAPPAPSTPLPAPPGPRRRARSPARAARPTRGSWGSRRPRGPAPWAGHGGCRAG